MSEKIRDAEEPLGNLKVVPDFFPRPEDLVFRDEGGQGHDRLEQRRGRVSATAHVPSAILAIEVKQWEESRISNVR